MRKQFEREWQGEEINDGPSGHQIEAASNHIRMEIEGERTEECGATALEIVRNQVMARQGCLHALGNKGITDQARWATRRLAHVPTFPLSRALACSHLHIRAYKVPDCIIYCHSDVCVECHNDRPDASRAWRICCVIVDHGDAKLVHIKNGNCKLLVPLLVTHDARGGGVASDAYM